ncbi:MAG: hypothetical protein WD278_08505 [Pirellulales bacterium]
MLSALFASRQGTGIGELNRLPPRGDEQKLAAALAVMPPRQKKIDREEEEPERDGLGIDEAVERIIEAVGVSNAFEGFETTSREFETLFAGATAAQLEQLRFHKNPSIALTAAWEKVRLTIPRLPARDRIRLDTQRFLGYVEGRLGVPVPEIWGNVVAGAEAGNRSGARFRQPDDLRYDDTGYGRATPGISVTRRGNSLFLKSGEVSVPLPIEVRARLPSDMSVHLNEEEGYVAVPYSMVAAPFPLFRIDPQSGKVLWRAELWGCGFSPIVTGPGHYHWVGLVRQKDLLIVFGVGTLAAYVEGFAVTDGSNIFRFTTSYSVLYPYK